QTHAAGCIAPAIAQEIRPQPRHGLMIPQRAADAIVQRRGGRARRVRARAARRGGSRQSGRARARLLAGQLTAPHLDGAQEATFRSVGLILRFRFLLLLVVGLLLVFAGFLGLGLGLVLFLLFVLARSGTPRRRQHVTEGDANVEDAVAIDIGQADAPRAFTA